MGSIMVRQMECDIRHLKFDTISGKLNRIWCNNTKVKDVYQIFYFLSRMYPVGTLNKPTTQNIRDANDFVHAKRLAREECFTSRLSTLGNGLLVVEFVGISGKCHCLLPCDPIKKK